MKFRNVLAIVGLSVATSLVSIWGYEKLHYSNDSENLQESTGLPANYAGFFDGEKVSNQVLPVDFSAAASAATPAVVHIKTRIGARTVTSNQRRSPFADLFGDDFDDIFGGGGQRSMRIPEQRASGSGVLISNDGYIVTNNHVIDNADEIDVTLNNKKSYKAELIGADPSSDLAVLKITGSNLPYLAWGNSDDVKLGQWVLAIGYPWTLDVTVTAGIVSAKARSLGLNRAKSNNSPVESFIQTDAAVNQGNSGGALVDTDGKLIGINSAIASQTGSYAGYSYAIPVNIVKKIAGDLVKYGAVQRAYMGLQYMSDDAPEEELRKQNIKIGEGVYVSSVAEDGAAKQGGIKQGDYIIGINGVRVSSGSEMVEQIANYKPGDKIDVTYMRDGKEITTKLTLRNISGNYDIVKNTTTGTGNALADKLGGTFEDVEKATATRYGIAGGVQVKKINGGLLKGTRMQEDFVITSVNGQAVKSTTELMNILGKATGTVRLEGIYPGFEGTYAYPLNMNSRVAPAPNKNQ